MQQYSPPPPRPPPQLNPGWISAFSAGFLRPRLRYVQVRLGPGVCPPGTSVQVRLGGEIETALRAALSAKPNEAFIHHTSFDGECEYAIEGTEPGGQAIFSRRDSSWAQSITLTSLFVVTLVIPLCVACAALVGLRRMVIHVNSRLYRAKRQRAKYRMLRKVAGAKTTSELQQVEAMARGSHNMAMLNRVQRRTRRGGLGSLATPIDGEAASGDGGDRDSDSDSGSSSNGSDNDVLTSRLQQGGGRSRRPHGTEACCHR